MVSGILAELCSLSDIFNPLKTHCPENPATILQNSRTIHLPPKPTTEQRPPLDPLPSSKHLSLFLSRPRENKKNPPHFSMASSSSNTNTPINHHSATTYGSDSASPNTTFVQADPSNFRTIVQKLTGASDDPSTQKLPVTHPPRPTSTAPTTATTPGPKRPAFKLHERRLSGKNLQINLNKTTNNNSNNSGMMKGGADIFQLRQRAAAGFLVSPVSPLDMLQAGRVVSPRSPCEELHHCTPRGNCSTPREESVEAEVEEEERAIAEKRFYLHPISPLSTPRGGEPPELLPLFPLQSPKGNGRQHDCNSCS